MRFTELVRELYNWSPYVSDNDPLVYVSIGSERAPLTAMDIILEEDTLEITLKHVEEKPLDPSVG